MPTEDQNFCFHSCSSFSVVCLMHSFHSCFSFALVCFCNRSQMQTYKAHQTSINHTGTCKTLLLLQWSWTTGLQSTGCNRVIVLCVTLHGCSCWSNWFHHGSFNQIHVWIYILHVHHVLHPCTTKWQFKREFYLRRLCESNTSHIIIICIPQRFIAPYCNITMYYELL
jgi:hypothetical protein